MLAITACFVFRIYSFQAASSAVRQCFAQMSLHLEYSGIDVFDFLHWLREQQSGVSGPDPHSAYDTVIDDDGSLCSRDGGHCNAVPWMQLMCLDYDENDAL